MPSFVVKEPTIRYDVPTRLSNDTEVIIFNEDGGKVSLGGADCMTIEELYEYAKMLLEVADTLALAPKK